MATMHHSKNELKIKHEKLKYKRLLAGKLAFPILIIICSVALLYAILDPQGLREWIKSCYWGIAPDGGFLSDLVCLIMVATQGLVYVVWLATYPLLIYIICFCVFRLRKQDYGKKTEEEAILELAVKGEEKVLSVLSKYPDWCHIYTNITVPWKDENGKKKSSHLDIILVSPYRIIVVKVKNLKGTICGNVSDQNLIQKTYRNGTIFQEKTFYNPAKQVQTHAKALSAYLKEYGVRHTIYNCVFFSNDDVELKIKGETGIYSACPFFEDNNSRWFYSYFSTRSCRLYSDEEIRKVLLLLDQLVENPGS